MVRPTRTAIEDIQQGAGKDIARLLFMRYKSRTQLTKDKYKDAWQMRGNKKQQTFVMPIIDDYCREWEELDFLYTSPIKTTFTSKGYCMNMNPIFEFMKNKGVELTEEQKKHFEVMFGNTTLRFLILYEYPQDDIINATLKFYFKNLISKYLNILNDYRNNRNRYDKPLNNFLKNSPKWVVEGYKKANRGLVRSLNALKSGGSRKLDTNDLERDPIDYNASKVDDELYKDYKRYEKLRNKDNKSKLNQNEKTEFENLHIKILLQNEKRHLYISYQREQKTSPDIIKSIDIAVIKSLGLA